MKLQLWFENYVPWGFHVHICKPTHTLKLSISRAHAQADTLQPYHTVNVMGECANCCSAPEQQEQRGLANHMKSSYSASSVCKRDHPSSCHTTPPPFFHKVGSEILIQTHTQTHCEKHDFIMTTHTLSHPLQATVQEEKHTKSQSWNQIIAIRFVLIGGRRCSRRAAAIASGYLELFQVCRQPQESTMIWCSGKLLVRFACANVGRNLLHLVLRADQNKKEKKKYLDVASEPALDPRTLKKKKKNYYFMHVIRCIRNYAWDIHLFDWNSSDFIWK